VTRWPGWALAWAVTAGLIVVWILAMKLSPVNCNLHGNCPLTSGFGIFLVGGPVVVIALLVSLVMSAIAWWRRR